MIANPTGSRFELLTLEALACKEDGTAVADLVSQRAVLIPAKFDNEVTMPVEIRILDPLQLIFGSGINFDRLTADITVTARQNGIFTQTKKMEKVPLSTLIKFSGK